jgi:GT2 family glycosyltransferase
MTILTYKTIFRKGLRLLKQAAFSLLSPFPGIKNTLQTHIDRLFVKLTNRSFFSKIYYNFDCISQKQDVVAIGQFTVDGWAFSVKGNVTIEVSIDGHKFASFQPSFFRQDVKNVFPAIDDSCDNAFSVIIDLRRMKGGAHQVAYKIYTENGEYASATQQIYLVQAHDYYNVWVQYMMQGHDLEAARVHAPLLNSKSVVLHILYDSAGDPEAAANTLSNVCTQQYAGWIVYCVGISKETLFSALNDEIQQILQHKIQFVADFHTALHTFNSVSGYFTTISDGELLREQAYYELLQEAIASDAQLVYSDHDQALPGGRFGKPVFTFGWSPQMLLSFHYPGDVYVASTALLKELPTSELAGYWRYELLLELGSIAPRISRVPKMLWAVTSHIATLHHGDAEKQAVERFLQRRGAQAVVRNRKGRRYIDWQLPEEAPLVSIIIPTTGKLELVRACIESLMTLTDYARYEIIILDNSRGKNPEGIAYLREKGLQIIVNNDAFNWSKLNNLGAKHAKGSLLLFLNDDIEITEAGWLKAMVKEAIQPGVGAVGAMLLYDNGAIQHAGVILVNYGGYAMHLFAKLQPGAGIYLGLDNIVREITANTGACLLVARSKYEEMGGFEEDLAIVSNDVDFCLRLSQRGYRNIWTPACQLIHHESISRKNMPHLEDELFFQQRWAKLLHSGDPYYNPNLSQKAGDCTMNQAIPVHYIRQHFQSPALLPVAEGAQREGVNLIGYIRAEMGVGEGARSSARALSAAAIHFDIINFETGNPARMQDFSWIHKEVKTPSYDINLVHINADHFSKAVHELPPHVFEGRYTIGHWSWEMPEIPPEWMPAFEYVDEVWVPSDFVKHAVEQFTDIPVVIIPFSVDIRADNSFSKAYFGIPENTFCFLFMYDIRSILERKNPQGTLDAFKNAFEPDDTGVCLVLKVMHATAAEITSLKTAIGIWQNVIILEGVHQRHEITALLTFIDCYVSLHRSEGFGLTPAEAMCLGKSTIITHWSGSTDYMNAHNCISIDYQLVELQKDYGPYRKGQYWAEPNLEMAAEAMVMLRENPEIAQKIGAEGQKTIKTQFSPEAIGARIAERLHSIRRIQA